MGLSSRLGIVAVVVVADESASHQASV